MPASKTACRSKRMASPNEQYGAIKHFEIRNERRKVMEWLQIIAAIISGLAAILAWVAKIRWADEYSKAKEEVIRAKDIQIDTFQREIQSLKNLTPMKVQEYFNSVKAQLGGYIEFLKSNLEKAVVENDELGIQIESYQSMGESYEYEISRLIEDKRRLEDQILEMKRVLESLQIEYYSANDITEKMNNHNGLYLRWLESLNHKSNADISHSHSPFHPIHAESKGSRDEEVEESGENPPGE
jgi:chromosome segregation ATPase